MACGAAVHLMMNLVVLPLLVSETPVRLDVVILTSMFCVGLPIALVSRSAPKAQRKLGAPPAPVLRPGSGESFRRTDRNVGTSR
jgi:hypothetical protein